MFSPDDFSDVCINIIGLGNIGSHAALTLARMGIRKFVLWDPDIIEEHNLTSQTYSRRHLEEFKVTAIKTQIEAISPDIEVIDMRSEFSLAVSNNLQLGSNIYVIGVDSLEARRNICADLAGIGTTVIDGRIGGEQLEVYTLPSQEWADTIPDEAAPEPCGGEYICYVSAMIGGIIACQVKKVLTNQQYPKSLLMNMGTYDILKNHAW